MSAFKDRKLLVVAREFEKVGTRYEINGIDLSKAVFFWRLPTEMYDVIPKGSYSITTENNVNYLNITDTVVYPNVERIQICYEFASISSEYQVDFNVDINILKDRYNEVVSDVKSLFNHVQKMGIVADGNDVSIVLPELSTGEVWMRTDTGYKGFNVSDIEENIKDFWIRFDELTKQVLDEIKNQGDLQNDRVLAQGNTQIDRINSATTEIDGRLQMIWRMYSILTGSQRYLSGNVVSLRNPNNIEKTVDGGLITNRVGDPKRIYSGGAISNRTIKAPITLDLGEFK